MSCLLALLAMPDQELGALRGNYCCQRRFQRALSTIHVRYCLCVMICNRRMHSTLGRSSANAGYCLL